MMKYFHGFFLLHRSTVTTLFIYLQNFAASVFISFIFLCRSIKEIREIRKYPLKKKRTEDNSLKRLFTARTNAHIFFMQSGETDLTANYEVSQYSKVLFLSIVWNWKSCIFTATIGMYNIRSLFFNLIGTRFVRPEY